jgi:hypothetical protein
VDAQAEVVTGDALVTGRLLGLQIKGGDSYFGQPKGEDGWVFRANNDHLAYWLGHSLPIVVVLVNSERQAFWQVITTKAIKEHEKGFSVLVPRSQPFDGTAREALLALAGRREGLLEQLPSYYAVLPPAAVTPLRRAEGTDQLVTARLGERLADGHGSAGMTAASLVAARPSWLVQSTVAQDLWIAVAVYASQRDSPQTAIPLIRLDSLGIQRIQQEIPAGRNPFTHYKRIIISIDTLKGDAYRQHLENMEWDAVVIDESHNLMGSGNFRNKLAKRLAPRTHALLLASATPHNGNAESFAELVNMLDPAAIADRHHYEPKDVEHLYIRRTKVSPEVTNEIGAKWAERGPSVPIRCQATPPEERVFEELRVPEEGRRPGEDLIRRERIGPDRAAGAEHDRHDDTTRRSWRRRWLPLRGGVLARTRVGFPPRHECPGGRHSGQVSPGHSRAAHSAAKAAQPGGTPAGQASRSHDGATRVRAAPMPRQPRS